MAIRNNPAMLIVETENSTYQINDTRTAARRIRPSESTWNPCQVLNLEVGQAMILVSADDTFVRTSVVVNVQQTG